MTFIDFIDQVAGELDVDTPIPFTISPAGRRYLAREAEQERLDRCQHCWSYSKGWMSCSSCGLDQQVRFNEGIPSHIGAKPGERR